MSIGELLRITFMISQKLLGCNRSSFDAAIFLGASENENVGGFRR